MKMWTKPWIPPKRPGEVADTARISKAAKVRPEDIKVKAEIRRETDGIQLRTVR